MGLALKSGNKKTLSTFKVKRVQANRHSPPIFFHPDFTVGPRISLDQSQMGVADFTADREFHPALKIASNLFDYNTYYSKYLTFFK